ncbi:polysaccharide pyruvyl transferase family protein [Idiomarina abyssalis]|uniref:polysaccharide pyruvyl transferase family protein n=1 Tax=Idiomarina abyssalis TaxID=86102 RepID=UPI003A9138E9
MSNEKPYYVILTGSKNNAGDFLIKFRAKELFEQLRPDRSVIDMDAWKPFSDKDLELVNGAEALILMGGPALQKHMYPGIYPLVNDLDKIKVPITCMGIGWKSLSGNWSDSRGYPLLESTKQLLSRMLEDGLPMSVRDYHTLNVLHYSGVNHGLMTGCPATYVTKKIGSSVELKESRQVSFSLGVSFLESKSLEVQMKNLILQTRELFKGAEFVVVFHHSLSDRFLKSHNASNAHLDGHREFASWLSQNDIKYIDISGSAENLIEHYEQCDFHIGYRVHAHIFMSSISKPSVLIAEDGRGKALRQVFGGLVFDAFENVQQGLLGKLKRKFGFGDTYEVATRVESEVIDNIRYELTNSLPRILPTRHVIDSNFRVMERFLSELP